MPKQVQLFGVRHHGPGSARAVLRALDAMRPQCVLIEGPPDADGVIASAALEDMRPPVAILIYRADDPKQAVFYPFAEFSPEWSAIRWALATGVAVRFMDLPQAQRLSVVPSIACEQEAADGTDGGGAEDPASSDAAMPGEPDALPSLVRIDPLNELARAAGFDDGERWWEHTFENRRQPDVEVFTAIREAIGALREEKAGASSLRIDRNEPLREAWMRRTIRQAQREFDEIAVICGAWHVPALGDAELKSLKRDDESLLKSLGKVKTVATWIPWTYGRLTVASGYGAGIHSPGWYEHLWRGDSCVLERWMTRVGRLLREEGIDCSSAHIIEATRLATSLAALRGRPLADLSDIVDACRAVFCFDSDLAMRLVAKKLLVGERLGQVPEDTALVPLQLDLQSQQKRLRLKPEALDRVLDLDLRSENDLRRSELLHRLRLLGITWGTLQPSRVGKGTFHELWQLRWEPEYLVRLIELGVWGNTIEAAAAAFTMHQASEAADLEQLSLLLGDLLLANLPDAVHALVSRILSAAAVGADVAKLMDALPPLAEVFRYGNVRQTDKDLIRRAIDGVLPRILVGLGGAVASLNDEAAKFMEQRIVRVHEAVQLLDSPGDVEQFLACIGRIADQPSVHGLVRGRCTRLIFDSGSFTSDEVARRMSLTLSRGSDAAQAAAWVEGFLSSSGLLLLHHRELLGVIDEWLVSIPAEVFIEQVPLLRRTFSTFAPAERRQIGERLSKEEGPSGLVPSRQLDLDAGRAARVIPILRALFRTAAREEQS
jgi:hypothetical protein